MLVILAFGLSMDAFAISVTNGMCYRNISLRKLSFSCAAAFGFFQGLMPVLGYLVGSVFSKLIERYDHWIALFLLSLIGGKMIVEAVKGNGDPEYCPRFSGRTLAVQAVATSVDAMAVGVSFAVIGVNILFAGLTIAAITFVCCLAGVLAGRRFGLFLRGKAELLGGVILILIGLHIFIEHVLNGI